MNSFFDLLWENETINFIWHVYYCGIIKEQTLDCWSLFKQFTSKVYQQKPMRNLEKSEFSCFPSSIHAESSLRWNENALNAWHWKFCKQNAKKINLRKMNASICIQNVDGSAFFRLFRREDSHCLPSIKLMTVRAYEKQKFQKSRTKIAFILNLIFWFEISMQVVFHRSFVPAMYAKSQ